MSILHSVQAVAGQSATTFEWAREASSPYMVTASYEIPKPPVCIHNFASVRARMVPPFKITLIGTVADVADVELTSSGTEKHTFIVVDYYGNYIRCCAVGRNARHSGLRDGERVVLYHLSGRGENTAHKNTLWLFKDAVIVPVCDNESPPFKRSEMVL